LTLGQETFQPITINYQVAAVAKDEMVAFKLDKEFAYPRTRGAHQIRKVLVSRGYRQAYSALIFDPKILAKFKQNQRDPLFQRTTHEIHAA
jgi:hypothetical protein